MQNARGGAPVNSALNMAMYYPAASTAWDTHNTKKLADQGPREKGRLLISRVRIDKVLISLQEKA